MRRSLAAVALALVFTGCGQNLDLIAVPAPEEHSPAAACGVVSDALVSQPEALCIAKVAGLSRGVSRWRIREYDTYIDVFTTTRRFPTEEGENVRIARRGGAVLEKSRWKAVTVR